MADDSPLVKATCDDRPIELTWQGRYVRLDNIAAGKTVGLTFPIAAQTVAETIGRVPYQLTFKGNTLVSVEPHGTRMPLYQHEQYLKDKAPMHQVSRFVADGAPFVSHEVANSNSQ